MLRAVRNLFLLLLTGIVASATPLYVNSLDFSDFTSLELTEKSIKAQGELIQLSENQTQIRYTFSTNRDNMELPLQSDNPFIIQLVENNEIIKVLDTSLLLSDGLPESMIISKENPTHVLLTFDQKSLNLPDGSYQVKIKPNISNDKFEFQENLFEISFYSNLEYKPALSSVTSKQTPLTLYFPNEEFNHLIPVTRMIGPTTSPLTMVLRNLEKGPDPSLGLPTKSPVPKANRVWMGKGIVHLYLPKNINGLDQGSATTFVVVNSFVRSLTSIPGASKVQFYFNNRIEKTQFHGLITDQPIEPPRGPYLYANYITQSGRSLLTPLPIDNFNISNPKDFKAIFNGLKYRNHADDLYDYNLQPIVPSKVELIDYQLNDNHLSLTFNDAFQKTLDEDATRGQLMIDGLYFTFTSIDGIEGIDFKVQQSEGNNTRVINYDFAQPIYINPEK